MGRMWCMLEWATPDLCVCVCVYIYIYTFVCDAGERRPAHLGRLSCVLRRATPDLCVCVYACMYVSVCVCVDIVQAEGVQYTWESCDACENEPRLVYVCMYACINLWFCTYGQNWCQHAWAMRAWGCHVYKRFSTRQRCTWWSNLMVARRTSMQACVNKLRLTGISNVYHTKNAQPMRIRCITQARVCMTWRACFMRGDERWNFHGIEVYVLVLCFQ